ncbi:MAG: hypothetical protein IJB81_11445 [Clostridia bacterium]|nr:hypothetical protein [Clostridia bacterium]
MILRAVAAHSINSEFRIPNSELFPEESLSGQAMDEARAACIRELLAMS